MPGGTTPRAPSRPVSTPRPGSWTSDASSTPAPGPPPPPGARASDWPRAHRVGNTFGAFARTWRAARHDLRPTTRASYATAITPHLEPLFGATPLTEITTLAVRKWFATYGDLDLDLDAGALRVRQGAIRIKGALVAGPPKTAAAVRDVAMPALVVIAI
ncbi:hypothetical protein V3N99_00055 [Dermatophilaceae bacterium Soc4.6]